MFDLYRAELRRFCNGAAAFAGAHLVVLAIVQQLLELTTAPMGVHLVLLFGYMLTGCALAAIQFGSYRTPSRWIWLLHRPLHRGRILGALALAALTFACLAVLLPMLAVLAAQGHFTYRVIEARHYGGAVCLALAALSGWLAGGWVMLQRTRWAFLVFALPVILCMHTATAGTVVALWLVCAAILMLLLYTVFRPNRTTDAGAATFLPAALVLQLGFYIALLWSGTLLFEVGQLVLAPQAQAGSETYRDAMRLTVPDRLRSGLAGSAAPDAAAWRASLAQDNALRIGPNIRFFDVPGLVTTRGIPIFKVGEEKWTYSADAGMYRGLNMRSGADAGWFGTGGPGATGRFDRLPAPASDNRGGSWMVDTHDLYAVDGKDQHLTHALRLDDAEWLTGSLTYMGPDRLLLTSRRIVMLEPAGTQLAVRRALVLPVPFGDVGAVDAARVAGGTLVSVLSGYRQADTGTTAEQRMYLFDAAGGVREVGRRALAHDYPTLFEHRGWWLSPVLHAAVLLPELLLDHGEIPDDRAGQLAPLQLPRPPMVWVAAVAGMLLAGAGAAWHTRRLNMAPGARLAWCLAGLVLGMPALLTLLVLAPRARAVSVPALAGAPAAS
jgi:hypothetical protein